MSELERVLRGRIEQLEAAQAALRHDFALRDHGLTAAIADYEYLLQQQVENEAGKEAADAPRASE